MKVRLQVNWDYTKNLMVMLLPVYGEVRTRNTLSKKSLITKANEEKNGFIRVKFDDENYWISLDELAANDGELFPWKTYFLDVDNHMLVLCNMNLRTAPTVNSDKIMLVKKPQNEDDLHIIGMTDNIQGNWAEVNIHIMTKSDYCRKGYGSGSIVKGWIKHLDDKGFPNIFPARILCGC